MRKKIILLTAVLTALAGCSKDGTENILVDGSYTGVGNGHDGPITVEMTVASHRINGVTVVSHHENEELARPVFNQLIDAILNKQDVDEVDAISGATITSNGFLNASYDAQSQARSGKYIPRHGPRFQ